MSAIALRGATLRFANRTLWADLDLTVEPGEVLAVLGPNGAGKTSLVKVLLGLLPLSAGTVQVLGSSPQRARRRVALVPQHRPIPASPLRARDFVSLGVDGHRWGLPGIRRSQRVDDALSGVGAASFARRSAHLLSGGEQQRLRVAQAMASDPQLILADEPLLSLDPRSQAEVVSLIDRRRHEAGTAVVIVTHELNPVLPAVDRILYLAGGRWALGSPDDVLDPVVLGRLYGKEVDVVRVRGRVLVVPVADGLGVIDPHHEPEDVAGVR